MSAALPIATYEQDAVLWSALQARLLRERRLDELDVQHLIDEVEGFGERQAEALRGRMAALLARLLMWKYLPGARLPSWHADISGERRGIAGLLQRSPSLGSRLADIFSEAYGTGRSRAAAETGIDVALLPASPPFTLEQARDDGYLPLEPDREAFSRPRLDPP